MIKTYNGKANRQVMRDLKKICEVCDENKKNLYEKFNVDGKVSIYQNLDFFGMPDEFSSTITLKTKAEVEEFLKKDFLSRIDGFLTNYKVIRYKDDYLISMIAEYIKTNGSYPENEEMRKLEVAAEKKRLQEHPEEVIPETLELSKSNIATELLEFAEEIMESRRETNPKDIFIHLEPYDDDLFVKNDEFHMRICYNRYDGNGTSADYSCEITPLRDARKGALEYIDRIIFGYYYDNPQKAWIRVEGWNTEKYDSGENIPLEDFISMHKFVSEMAKKEGIAFSSQINYEDLKTA